MLTSKVDANHASLTQAILASQAEMRTAFQDLLARDVPKGRRER